VYHSRRFMEQVFAIAYWDKLRDGKKSSAGG